MIGAKGNAPKYTSNGCSSIDFANVCENRHASLTSARRQGGFGDVVCAGSVQDLETKQYGNAHCDIPQDSIAQGAPSTANKLKKARLDGRVGLSRMKLVAETEKLRQN